MRSTKKYSGITTAAAITIIRPSNRRMKSQRGIPQQRLPGFFCLDAPFSFGPPRPIGHSDMGRVGVPSRGVASPGGGNAASIPESPELRVPGETNYVSIK